MSGITTGRVEKPTEPPEPWPTCQVQLGASSFATTAVLQRSHLTLACQRRGMQAEFQIGGCANAQRPRIISNHIED